MYITLREFNTSDYMTRKCTLHLGNVIRGITGVGCVIILRDLIRGIIGLESVHYSCLRECNTRDYRTRKCTLHLGNVIRGITRLVKCIHITLRKCTLHRIQ